MDAREITTLVPRLLIRGYQIVRRGTNRNCRFWPTCSNYALEALKSQGLFGGSWRAIRRILKCHPWHAGGYDPCCREGN